MIAPLIWLVSLMVAFVALHGWAEEPGVWIRALIALGFLAVGIRGAWRRVPSPAARRLHAVRKPGALDHLINAGWIAMALSLLYGMLVFAPPTARQLHDFLFFAASGQSESSLEDSQASSDDGTGSKSARQGNEFEINTLHEPDGALVPSDARLISYDEPQVGLLIPEGTIADRLRHAGKIYLHAFSYDTFDGQRWTAQGVSNPAKLKADPQGLIHFRASDGAAVIPHVMIHYQDRGESNTLTSLQGLCHVRLPEVTQLDQGAWLLPARDRFPKHIHEYEAASLPQRLEDLIASGVPIEPGMADRAYLAASTDEALSLLVRGHAAGFQHDAPLGSRLVELQGWLSRTFAYSRQVQYPDSGMNAMESFLLAPGKREGFCVHFATAATLLLREMGIPSRVSYGWTGGEFYAQHHQFVFRGEHAHAWAEMFIKGRGWVIFEATPSAGLPPSESAPAGLLPPVAKPFAKDQMQEDAVADWPRLAHALGWISLCVAALLLFLLLLLKRRQRHDWGDLGFQADAAVAAPGYLQLFHQACAGMGHPRAGGTTLRQYLDQLERARISIPFADQLLGYHYGIIYRGMPRDPRLERHLCKQIKAL